MGVDREAAVGFTEIRLSFDLTAPPAGEGRDALVEATERYCVVLQTLARSPRLSVSAAG
jgi:hypothetical protein